MNLEFQPTRHRFASKPEKYSPLGKQMYDDMQTLGLTSKTLSKALGLKGSSYISHILHGDFPNSPMVQDIQKYLAREMRKRSEAIGK